MASAVEQSAPGVQRAQASVMMRVRTSAQGDEGVVLISAATPAWTGPTLAAFRGGLARFELGSNSRSGSLSTAGSFFQTLAATSVGRCALRRQAPLSRRRRPDARVGFVELIRDALPPSPPATARGDLCRVSAVLDVHCLPAMRAQSRVSMSAARHPTTALSSRQRGGMINSRYSLHRCAPPIASRDVRASRHPPAALPPRPA